MFVVDFFAKNWNQMGIIVDSVDYRAWYRIEDAYLGILASGAIMTQTHSLELPRYLQSNSITFLK